LGATGGGFGVATGGGTTGVGGPTGVRGVGGEVGGSTCFVGADSGRADSGTTALPARRQFSRRLSPAWMSKTRNPAAIAPTQLPIVTAVSAPGSLDRAPGFQHA